MNKLPTHAIISVTLNCNSKCVMCNIWKNKIHNEITPQVMLNLPSTLIDINLTGGEPFLRPDIDEFIANTKKACPKARIILNTNGFLTNIIENKIKQILIYDPKIAIRVSIDGQEETHDLIRKIPGGYKKVIKTIAVLKKAGVKDLGVSFTIMEQNYKELPAIYKLTQKQHLELSLTLASDSPIYFGKNKSNFRPTNKIAFAKEMEKILKKRYKSYKAKELFRAWFEQKLLEYYKTGIRAFSCNAGTNSFYMDSLGGIFTCQLKNWKMGNIQKEKFDDIWQNKSNQSMREKCKNCNDCWMVCSAKTSIIKHILKVGKDILVQKVKYETKVSNNRL